MNDEKTESLLRSSEEMDAALSRVCDLQLGVLNTDFLCQTVASLELSDPHTVPQEASLDSVLVKLREIKHGCVLIVDDQDKLQGIFSERDYILKVYGQEENLTGIPVVKYMTADPVTQPPDATLAHLLNLMSHGGFRHIPIVDQSGTPIWLVSVKDIVDYIVTSFTDSLLDFPVTE